MKTFKQFFIESNSLVSLTDDEFKRLYDILNRWSSDVELVDSQEMAFVKQFQSLFSYTGIMHRVLWLTPYKELSAKEIKQIRAKEDISKYKRTHSEHSWSKSLKNVKDFAINFLEDDFEFEEFSDKKIQQLITVLCKQTATGFDVEKFYKAYNKKFKIIGPRMDPISASANIKEIIAPLDVSFTAKPAETIDGVVAIINRSGNPLEGGNFVPAHLRPKVYNVTGDYSKGKQLWVDISTGKRFKGNPNTDTVEFVFLSNGKWDNGYGTYYNLEDFPYKPGDAVKN